MILPGFSLTTEVEVDRNQGFTLMELLVVITIIMMLAGFVMGANQAARRRASVNKARTEIAAMDSALSMYEQDMGEYPQGKNKDMVKALMENSSGDSNWYGPYIELKEDDLDSDGNYIDPWGNPYVYVYPGEHNKLKYDFYSLGPNRKDDNGAKDDVKNW